MWLCHRQELDTVGALVRQWAMGRFMVRTLQRAVTNACQSAEHSGEKPDLRQGLSLAHGIGSILKGRSTKELD